MSRRAHRRFDQRRQHDGRLRRARHPRGHRLRRLSQPHRRHACAPCRGAAEISQPRGRAVRETLRRGNTAARRGNLACVASIPDHDPHDPRITCALRPRRQEIPCLALRNARMPRHPAMAKQRTRRATRAGTCRHVEQQEHERARRRRGRRHGRPPLRRGLRSRDPDGLWRVTVIGEEDRAPLRPGRPHVVLRRRERRRPDARSARSSTTRRPRALRARRRGRPHRPRGAPGDDRQRAQRRLRHAGARHRLVRRRLARRRIRPGRLLRLPHPRRRRGSSRVRRAALRGARPPGCGEPSSAAGCSGSRPPGALQGAGRRTARSCSVGPADVGCSSTSGGARLAAPAHRVRAASHVRTGQRRPPDSTPTSAATSAALEFRDGRLRRHGRRRVRRRRAAARRARPRRPGWRSARAAASSSTRRARPPTPASSRSARSPASTAAASASSRPATRWPRSPPTGCSAAPRRSPAPTTRPSSSCSGSTSPASATRSRQTPGALEVVYADPVAGVYKKLVLSDDAQTLLGGILVGDASAYGMLRPLVGGPLGARPRRVPAARGRRAMRSRAPSCPTQALVCSCNNVTAGTIRCAVTDEGCTDVAGVKACTRAGTACGSCLPLVKKLVGTELARSGVSRQHRAVRALRALPRAAVRRRAGVGAAHVQRDHRALRHRPRLRHLQAGARQHPVLPRPRPRARRRERARCRTPTTTSWRTCRRTAPTRSSRASPGGEITPEGLLAIGQVAKDFGLYTKITGGQRIDMFGARLEQLPEIWQRLVDAGFESGPRLRQVAAHREVVRRLDVVPLRRAGLGRAWRCSSSCATAACASPHKIKLGVSGLRPRVRRGPRQGRRRDRDRGGLEHVRRRQRRLHPAARRAVRRGPRRRGAAAGDRPLPDVLRPHRRPAAAHGARGSRRSRAASTPCARSSSTTASASPPTSTRRWPQHVDAYEDEWKATLEDPEKLRRFASFVNAPTTPDPSLAYAAERGQRGRPPPRSATNPRVLIAGTTLAVRR